MPPLTKISTPPQRVLRISAAAAVFSFCVAVQSHAQQTQIDALAGQVAQVLEESHAKRVVVVDFSGPGLNVTQLGRDLADQFSGALPKSGGGFAVTDRTQLFQALSAAQPPMTTFSDLNSGQLAKTVRADTEVLGHLESDGTHVTLAVEVRRVENGKTVAKLHATLDESKKVDAQLAQVLSKADYPDSGAIGYTAATCQRCSIPRYTDAAFKAHVEGLVELSAVIETDGRASHIIVEKKLGAGLDERTVETVQSWKFKPALGPDGKPAAVRMLIEAEFHLGSRPR